MFVCDEATNSHSPEAAGRLQTGDGGVFVEGGGSARGWQIADVDVTLV